MKPVRDLWLAHFAAFANCFANRSFLLSQRRAFSLPIVGSMLPPDGGGITSLGLRKPPASFVTQHGYIIPHPREDAPPPTLGRSPSDGPPAPPLGDRTTTVHTRLQAQKLKDKTKELSVGEFRRIQNSEEFSVGCVQRAANVQRPTP